MLPKIGMLPNMGDDNSVSVLLAFCRKCSTFVRGQISS